jgi:hypothetical protein
MPKPVIPAVPSSAGAQGRALFDASVKETLEVITGARVGKITALPSGATLADVIAKVNEIVARLQ